jgi:poly-gamma-glutamate synthesis protein (capsule biosynthesis protein)
MIFDRNVADLIASAGGAAPLAEVAPTLKAADVAVGNLESTLSDGGSPAKGKDVTFRGDPAAIAGLKEAGFDAVSIANNHVLDYGADALADSISLLDEAGITHAGAGKDQAAAWKPASFEANGAKVAYLAFSHIVPAGFIAQPDRAGMASGRMDMQLVDDAIREAKKNHDYVLVSFHWGVEYEDFANATQEQNAHRAVDAGADMVLAHHPHVIQGVEFYKGRLIAYSLGDFVFDHYSRKTGEAFILNAKLGPNGVEDVTAKPVYLDGHGRPEFVEGSDATTILARLKRISAPHGTTVKVDGAQARLLP